MGGYKPDSPSGVKNRDALFKLIQDIKPADQAAPTELPANYNNMVENLRGRYDEFSQKAGLPRLQDQTPKTQQGQLKAFDTYLKGADPELWRAKQLVDYTAGVGTAQGAINYYGKKLINPAFGLRNALLWGGGALAAGGAGYLLWRLLRKDTQEKTAETDEERRKRERLLTGAYAGGLGLAGLGLLSMNKTDLSRLEQFSQAADRWKANPDPRNDLRDYSALGHAAMQTKFMGNSASDILRFAGKNNPLVVKPWDDWKERHYKQFENSPLSAYLVRAREWSELPSETAETPTLSRLDSLQDPVKRFGADKLKDTSIAMAALPRSAAPYAVGEDYFKNYSKLVADTGGAIKPDPQFFAKLQRASNDYMAANKIDESTMPLAGQRELLNRIDAHIKQTDPELWKTKQWYDFDMGRASTIHSAQNYKKLMSPFMWFRKYAPMVGAITASVGAVGLLYYALKSRKSAKQKQPVVPVEAKLAEEKRTAWGRLAILALLAGGTGLAAHHLLANRNQPKPATPPAPETKPTAPDETPAPKPAEPVAAQPVETPKPAVPAAGPPKPAGPLDSFKSYWSSMPEWRRARAFQKLQDEFPEPDKFSELGWMQKQKLKLLAGQSERDQYGPTYAGLAKFVLYNPNREMLRGAFDIARADPGRDY
jgi:hypothetical protein